MKTKKILAVLSAISMIATTMATQVWAKDGLVDISSTATMTVDGYDGFWNVSQAIDKNIESSAGIYNYQDHQYIQANFDEAQLIKDIVVENANEWGWTGAGKVKSIWLSNDANFGTYEEMTLVARINDTSKNEHSEYVDYKSEWTCSGNIPYKYVRIYGTPADTYYTNWGTDHTLSFVIKELYIYAKEKKDVQLVDISRTATMSVYGNDQFWAVGNANDGNNETTAGIYGYDDSKYIQADFGTSQIITNVDVENANEWGWTGTGKVKKILLSNDPDFGAYEEMSLLARINDKNPDRCEYVDYMSKWLYSGNVPYRYVRIYAIPAAAGYTNWGDDQTPCFAIKEMYVYAEENSAVENIKSEATMTVDGYDAFWSVANAVDGNLDTSAGIYNYQDHQYIQANFDKEQVIKFVNIENANAWGWQGTGKVKKILLSNDANFAEYEEMTLIGRINDTSKNAHIDYVDYKSHWGYTGNTAYKYMRIYAIAGSTEYSNYGTDTMPSFVIKDMDIYAIPKAEVEEPEIPEEPVEEIEIAEVNMGEYAGKAWDIKLNAFDSAKTYTANFTDGEDAKSGEIDFANVETEGSVAFAIFLHTNRANVALKIVAE